jgi:hypothetical protein
MFIPNRGVCQARKTVFFNFHNINHHPSNNSLPTWWDHIFDKMIDGYDVGDMQNHVLLQDVLPDHDQWLNMLLAKLQ